MFILSESQLLVSLIFPIVFFVSISFISVLFFMVSFLLLILGFVCLFCLVALGVGYVALFEILLVSRGSTFITVNFPLRTAFVASHRFWMWCFRCHFSLDIYIFK